MPSLDCDFTVIFDNEPRNREIVKNIEKAIEEDYSVVIWPQDIAEKDINVFEKNRSLQDKVRSAIDRSKDIQFQNEIFSITKIR